MKSVFAVTKNVKKFLAGVDNLMRRQKTIPGMMLVFGEPGTGKTRTALWWKIQNGNGENRVPYVRATRVMTPRALLEQILYELGETPMWKTSQILQQIKDHLLSNPRPIVVDEVDYLCRDAFVEVLRDIHDLTDVPVIMIGMAEADKKLMRFRHLYDRISVIVPFKLLDFEDVKSLSTQMLDVVLEDDLLKYIVEKSRGKLRRIVTMFYKAERIAKASKAKRVSLKMFQGGSDE
ncbi:AAA domain-containing protein [Desulfonauticus submarinus]|uniref:AAA domain-containing protein n=1 Tax=Desulfonauticus submarinus TaxID=206665 RepID=A0A1H0G936_9BACT|nr:ATP-binding protein [Desulfonauticus submarinus]SDO03368.1 AAA domain-containing protein [Desulfonauticus submarinus]